MGGQDIDDLISQGQHDLVLLDDKVNIRLKDKIGYNVIDSSDPDDKGNIHITIVMLQPDRLRGRIFKAKLVPRLSGFLASPLTGLAGGFDV